MFIALTGTPGTGKTSVSNLLKKDYNVLHLNEIAFQNNFFLDFDKKRNTKILDLQKIDDFISNNYSSEKIFLIEGHAAHLLDVVEKVIILRCHPKILKIRLENKGWNTEKIIENVEAESLDIILCETVDYFSSDVIFEIDTTDKKSDEILTDIKNIINGKIKNYGFGKIDWSEEII